MPLYTYQCKHCKDWVEIVRTMAESEEPPTETELTQMGNRECKHELERKLKGAPGIVKGGGWGSGKGYW